MNSVNPVNPVTRVNPAGLPERVMVLRIAACEAGTTGAAGAAGDPRSALWAEALACVQQTVPGAVPLRLGCCVVRARGAARFYGSEGAAAAALLACLPQTARQTATVGVACGRFAAELAASLSPGVSAGHPGAHAPADGARVVEAADTVAFLAPWPIWHAADEQLTKTLVGLGVRTLGAFAAFSEHIVLQRFGQSALAAHRHARGLGELHANEVPEHSQQPDHDVFFECEPPIESDDQLAFACSAYAERFVQGLQSQGLVCTELRVELREENNAVHERHWSHTANFTVADVVNRVRWQAVSAGAGIASVRLSPARTARASDHEPGLFNDAPDERVHHQLTRVQALLGHQNVGTALLTGGRLSADRQRLVPWGTRPPRVTGAAAAKPVLAEHDPRPRDGPWPGSIDSATPTVAFDPAPKADLRGASGQAIDVDDDELLTERPVVFSTDTMPAKAVQAWSSPWPLRERWWRGGRTCYRLQVLLDDGEAWLLRYEPGSGWMAEGRYT